MIAALSVSAMFLVGYLTYHFTVHGVTRFRDPAWFRPIYLTLLLTHTVLAVAIVPMIIIALSRRCANASTRTKSSPAGPGRSGCTSR